MRHLYKLVLSHDDIYQDNSIIPQHCVGFIIRDTNVIITYCDEPEINTLSTANLISYLTMLRVSASSAALPHCKQLIDKNTLWYEQADISTLCQLYTPLAHSLARLVFDSTSFFVLDDLVQEVYLIITSLYKKGYYVHGSLIKRAFVNHIRMLMRKEPTHWEIVSLQKHLKDSTEDITLEDTIEDPASEDFITALCLSDEQQEQKRQLLTVISQRQYDQLVREYRTNTVPTAMGKKIREIRRDLGLE